MSWKKLVFSVTLAAIAAAVSQMVWAAAGAATEMVVVADTRVITSKMLLYFADLYNTDTTLFAIWATGLTAAYGCLLAFVMDIALTKTGIDLRSRKLIEH